MFVSLWVCVFILNRVRFQTAVSPAAEEQCDKIKTILCCCLLAAIPSEHELAHTRCGRRGFSIGPTRPRVILPARHRVLVFSIRAIYVTPLWHSLQYILFLLIGTTPTFGVWHKPRNRQRDGETNWELWVSSSLSSWWYKAVTGRPGVCARIAVIPGCSTAEITNALSSHERERLMTRLCS